MFAFMNTFDTIVSYYPYILSTLFFIFIVIRVNIYRKKFTAESCCPSCKATDSERMQRSFFIKIILFFKTVKKFKCLKCWNTYYTLETDKLNKIN